MNDLTLTDETMVTALAHTVQRYATAPAVHYLGRSFTWAEIDGLATGLAAGLRVRGVGHGDRVALLMQNVPQYMIALLATWRLGAAAVPINPMLTPREVRFVLGDADVAALIGLDELIARAISDDQHRHETPPLIVTTAPDELAGDWPERFGPPAAATIVDAVRWQDLIRSSPDAGSTQPSGSSGPSADDPAVLTYTSGTTGPPKGAINTHRNTVYACRFYERWVEFDERDIVLGIAPLFHITGLVAHLGPSIVTGAPLVLGYRFDVELIVDLIERYRPTFTIGAITAFIAMMNHPAIIGRDLSSLTKVYSGGAPIAPTTVDDFERRVGPYIHNIYGLTEATGPCLATPFGDRSPIDRSTGALAAGVPVSNTDVRLVREDGTDAGPGEPGEVAMRGPGVVPGYWRRPDETANAIRDGWLFTGDVAVRDERGWYYIVDRLKDQINASGFKVWPREVEDALMAHPDVVEAAVVGIPDEYRGETVKGFVVLAPGSTTKPDDLVGFCRDRLAAYKYPRVVEVVDSLPRNASGKILRRELRSSSRGVP
jgi:long-chain acyl-CoA synthetase